MEQLNQQVLTANMSLVQLIASLYCFFNNDIVVEDIVRIASVDGYDNNDGLVITYDKETKIYTVITSNNIYRQIIRSN